MDARFNSAGKVLAAAVLLSSTFGADSLAQEPAGKLSVSTNTTHEVIATVDGKVARCGVTALSDPPTFRISNRVIDIAQPVAGIACLANVVPGSVRPYHATVNLGHLAPGTYKINWSFPKLSASYTAAP